MNGVTLTGSASITGGDPNWVVAGAADFNGNGQADILWQNKTSGAVVAWYMNGATSTGNAMITGGNPNWVVTGPK
jgi:hypothetical protein